MVPLYTSERNHILTDLPKTKIKDTRETLPVEAVIEIFGKKWNLAVLCSLVRGPARFTQLKRELKFIGPRVLSESLGQLEKSQVVSRSVGSNRPPAVLYELTEKGKELSEAVELIKQWAQKWSMKKRRKPKVKLLKGSVLSRHALPGRH